uniref:EFHB C-terminal EF-hand domain-containing protein n=1 Tax=Heliothis virescens TaxID=7102 RepID=A0A2A4J8P3_HELVI
MLKCTRRTQGGKGNANRFIERDRYGIVAAGILSAQPDEKVSDVLKSYRLKDEVDALIGDSIDRKPQPIRPIQKVPEVRHSDFYNEILDVIYPPAKTKFEELVEDLKSTFFQSYWKTPLGKSSDQYPFLPEGFDVRTETMGRKSVPSESVYDVITPNAPAAKPCPSKEAGYQTNRNYSKPFDPKACFGVVHKPDTSGRCAKISMTDDRVVLGTANSVPRSSLEADFNDLRFSQLAITRQPNRNMTNLPPGYVFGKATPTEDVPTYLTYCRINMKRHFLLQCLGHLNKLKKSLSKRFNGLFFKQFSLYLKYFDKDKTGWIHKDKVYDYCSVKHIRVNPTLIEPLMEMWNGFTGTQMNYELFVYLINFQNPMPDLPKISDFEDPENVEYSTSYKDMTSHVKEVDRRRSAGLPSGRYFDCDFVETPECGTRAERANLPEETDTKTCLYPSTFTRFGVTHRDLFAKRSPKVVRRVFEAAGDKFTDESFNECWERAKNYHSEGWVSFETFNRALNNK